jgi:hypothetical protein
VHQANAAKRAIRTFKNHFIAGLCSTNKLFPLNLWDQLLPQAEITLNLLQTSCINPKLSAYTPISGAFDYNAMPLALLGTKIVIHEKPSVRGSCKQRHFKRVKLHLLARIIAWSPVLAEVRLI